MKYPIIFLGIAALLTACQAKHTQVMISDTTIQTSIEAIEKGLKLLKKGGIMTLIIYYGRETGFEERDALLEYLPTLDSRKYTVLEMPFVNRPNCPPIPIIIFKN